MSRVGKAPIKILPGVKVDISGNTVRVEGPKGKLSHKVVQGVTLKVADGVINVDVTADAADRSYQGLTRTLVHNMVHGVHTGFVRELDIVGVGFRAAVKGSRLTLTVGYSHPVEYDLPEGVSAKVENNTHIVLNGADKMMVGLVASKIRAFREPEPYQGKGIKYMNEHIVRKQGKAAGAK